MNIVILGPQGSGKGTQAEMLVKKYGFTHVETGEILRKMANSNHPWSKKIREMQNEGILVSDDILGEVIKDNLNSAHPVGFLFDGTPRNFEQYKLISEMLLQKGEKIDKVIFLEIPEEETVKRLSSRRKCEKCGKAYNLITNPPPESARCECGGELIQREDDYPETVRKRQAAFVQSTTKVIEIAASEGILIEINGEQSIEDIHNEIVEKLGL